MYSKHGEIESKLLEGARIGERLSFAFGLRTEKAEPFHLPAQRP